MAKDNCKSNEPDTRKHLQEITANGNHGARAQSSRTRPEDRGRAFIVQLKFTNFDKSSIYAIDVHPDGTRFAAGGMGDDSGRLCIWHINSLKAERVDVRLITQLDNHTACVNCLRWAHKGNYLASGAGDSLVMIWQQTRIGEMENWRRVHALHKHTADVLGLNWSPNDAMLASCSVDNSIIIWDALKNFECINVLTETNGTVKGVVWDPIGKYLATQSDERIKVYRTADWKLQYSVSDFFEQCHGSTQVLRLDWSTDGMNIISSHAANEGRPVAQIIERGAQDGWKSVNYFAGHSRPVVCVRFNPKMFTMKDENTPYCVCATGSRDHSVCVWAFQHKRPHVFTGLFDAPVMDISWFPDGYSLLACGLDGKIAYIYCGKLITGRAITKDQQSQALMKLYGKSVIDTVTNLLGSNSIVESSVFLDAQEAERRRKETAPSAPSSAQPAQIRLPYEGIPLTKQIEVRLPDGRLRITPVFIPESVPQPTTSFGAAMNGFNTDSSLDERSQQSNSGKSDAAPEEPAAPPVPMSRPLGPSALKAASRSVVSLPKKPDKPTGAAPVKKALKPAENGERPPEKKKDAMGAAKSSVNAAGAKRSSAAPAAVDGLTPVEKDVEIVAEKVPTVKPALLDNVLRKAAPVDAHVARPTPRPDRRPPQPTGRRLPLPPLLPRLTASVEQPGGMEADAISLVVENEIDSGNLNLLAATRFHKIQYLVGGRARWTQYLPSPIVLVATNESICCTISQDHSLNIWANDSGSLLAANQCLSAAGVQLGCSKNSVLVITADAKVDMWRRAHVFERWKKQSLGSIEWMLRSPAGPNSVAHTSVTDADVPVIGLSDHRYFVCDTADLSWCVVHDDVIRFGNYLATSGAMHAGVLESSNGPLSKLQKIRAGASVGRSVGPEISRVLLLNHMERQMHLARILKSPTEYQSWQLGYVQCLVDNDSVLRLRTLLDSLMGPPGNTEDLEESTWEPEILGMPKRMMLEKLLPLLGRKTQFQRMYIEYKQRLDLFGVRNLFATQDH